MECEDAFRLHKIDISNQIVVVRMIGKREGGIDLIAIDCIRIDCPTGDHRNAFARNFLDHRRMACARRTDKHLAGDVVFVVTHVFAERLTELFVNARHLINGTVQHRRQSGAIEGTQDFLGFA